MQYLTQIVLNGLVLASTYCLIAVGLTLVFGVMRIMNFAQGELYMIGAYVMLWASVQIHLPFFVGILLAALVTCAIGAVLERTVFRPLRVDPLWVLSPRLGFPPSSKSPSARYSVRTFRRYQRHFPSSCRYSEPCLSFSGCL